MPEENSNMSSENRPDVSPGLSEPKEVTQAPETESLRNGLEALQIKKGPSGSYDVKAEDMAYLGILYPDLKKTLVDIAGEGSNARQTAEEAVKELKSAAETDKSKAAALWNEKLAIIFPSKPGVVEMKR